MRADAVSCRCTREFHARALPAASPPPQVTSPMRTARGVRLSAGRRRRSFVGDRVVSRCVAGTGRPCSCMAHATGGSAAAERAGGGIGALVETSLRWRSEARARSRGGAWRRCMCGGGGVAASRTRLAACGWAAPREHRGARVGRRLCDVCPHAVRPCAVQVHAVARVGRLMPST